MANRPLLEAYSSGGYLANQFFLSPLWGIANEKDTPLFRTAKGKTKTLTELRMSQPEVYLMIRRRASSAGIDSDTFRGTGITAYLKNGGKLEVAKQMAAHESA